MVTVRKTITLTEQQGHWIRAQTEAGNYNNDSEYIRDLICREQKPNTELETIRAAISEGESSGTPRPFDPEAFKKRMLSVQG
ncbi:type II toxin-antitoxin system ParD family antitoxin [Pseudomonas sp. RIT-PI-r]|jgi:antitoxin ParD1/3/4|uniref:type II toxin-antitoxin system ParD family antitoxin n=1 Tax=Pseudomonas sp. RIT-PI-r TaxID=1699620 RepID=UPI0006D69D23|nr:type II toxin-antitoxin system ParD family antitoxin [Pseudomonas sp. RIT-PI-r]KPG96137.1 addiction module antitoxin [Pseudomonas sp. RIT-PI-r]